MMKTRIWRGMSGVAVAALALAACVEGSPKSVLAPSEASLGIRPNPGPPPNRTAELERLEVCKDYAAGSNAPALTDFTVVVTGPSATTFGFQLAPGACAEIWTNGPGQTDDVTVTETVPAGFTAAWTKTVVNNTANSPQSSSGNGNVASNVVGGPAIEGALIVFTNTPVPDEEPGVGRFTGGGTQTYNGVRVKIAFTLHCDIILSNNLEINWDKNKWHIDKPVDKATCRLDPNYNHPPPVAPLNTYIGEATGRFNGVDGSKAYFTIIDDGEPGKDDMFALKIVAPNGSVVLDVPLGKIHSGNFQAHYDQPHGNKPNK